MLGSGVFRSDIRLNPVLLYGVAVSHGFSGSLEIEGCLLRSYAVHRLDPGHPERRFIVGTVSSEVVLGMTLLDRPDILLGSLLAGTGVIWSSSRLDEPNAKYVRRVSILATFGLGFTRRLGPDVSLRLEPRVVFLSGYFPPPVAYFLVGGVRIGLW